MNRREAIRPDRGESRQKGAVRSGYPPKLTSIAGGIRHDFLSPNS